MNETVIPNTDSGENAVRIRTIPVRLLGLIDFSDCSEHVVRSTRIPVLVIPRFAKSA